MSHGVCIITRGMICESPEPDPGISSCMSPDIQEATDVAPRLEVSTVPEGASPSTSIVGDLVPGTEVVGPPPPTPGLVPVTTSIIEIRPSTDTPEEED